MNGLDLFSGIGGLSLALAPWVRPIAYCENERHAQAVLLSRMSTGDISYAPIWDDVRTLKGCDFDGLPIDIIYGGFPCQDISVAGAGAGLEGSRSELFFEIVRLSRELRPQFVFLENVPAIAVRGLERVLLEFTTLGYDCRWTTISAAEMGAPHIRERVWILAHSISERVRDKQQWVPRGWAQRIRDEGEAIALYNGAKKSLVELASVGRKWWAVEPDVGRVAHGVPNRVDRLRGLGNAVVPAQAREAFIRLAGLYA